MTIEGANFFMAPETFKQGTLFLLILLMIREMVRKGIALWKAGVNKRLARFVCLFVFNTVGILPIIYLIFFQKKSLNTSEKKMISASQKKGKK